MGCQVPEFRSAVRMPGGEQPAIRRKRQRLRRLQISKREKKFAREGAAQNDPLVPFMWRRCNHLLVPGKGICLVVARNGAQCRSAAQRFRGEVPSLERVE